MTEPMVRARALSGYLQVARRFGLASQELLRRVGLDAAVLANPEHRIPITAVCQLLEAAALKADCPTFGLQMADTRQPFDFGIIELLLSHKRTLREVLLAAVQYRHLLNEALAIHVEAGGDKVVVREEIVAEPGTSTRQATELAVGLLSRNCVGLLGEHWKPWSVNFTHPAPADLRFHRQFFGCPVAFDSDFNGIVCAAADLDRPNPNADPELVRYAESLARPLNESEQGSIALDVRKTIYLLLPIEQASVDEVAQHLHLSVRTMQRQLESAGTNFSSLVDEVRHELAVRYLTNQRYAIGRVAVLLGYSRQSSFTQWFTARFGTTPRAWRAMQRK
ncbi:AraC family transcriptional regulator (plasmid) [Cupriavidus taiwanensis]|uniref:AraC family transcriptional regulator n=2 Tax=Cupriavidus taiwanensis TaxID=164546 RepID=A0A375ILD3_9BURK|nr:AraC family transcriptional regulator [Cupriavidus taiwanensis]SPK74868.1 AraC family transcriptional regulator [Cupriavidus taiwanensis]